MYTRPNISFIVNKLKKFVKAPGDVHWLAYKRVLRFLESSLSWLGVSSCSFLVSSGRY
ncbi:hypothetical protein Syun_026304 [Stephania yunnanensis]|uniref:Uncharacterized protein n=1 Tax=Stephania yunnanensis TaxID=152371 RepID=A0AAP0ETQ6_9MAGN